MQEPKVRGYLALALADGPGSTEAVALAEKNLRVPAGADAKLNKGRERRMVNQIALGAALLGARRFGDAARELRDTLERNRDWNANDDLQWSALHLLARTLEVQGNYEEQVAAAREAMKFTGQSLGSSFHARVQKAIAVRDYASALAHSKQASADARAKALQDLDACCTGLDERYGVLTGALIESPPKAKEVASIRKILSGRR